MDFSPVLGMTIAQPAAGAGEWLCRYDERRLPVAGRTRRRIAAEILAMARRLGRFSAAHPIGIYLYQI
ncbi:hypothetical protein DBV23_01180 [Edwardsiella ictaluri]|nr:hypothetical protein B6E78_00660 [Edwardsiella ictaluri]AVZ81053.1 hypothetical protein DBV23_01180 [Edwardsiella ictaluri]KMQ77425.1 hypothetical protein ABY58_14705 [Edwardsiella ictaluri]KMQ78409.1 hypothetical protein ABY58_08690 [Edwardsiella ictaluri]KOO54162.1 hypothetical protein ACS33_15660 [Edwardsiella ictaluri]